MEFDWFRANIAHIARHEVTPDEAEEVLRNDPFDAGAVLRNGEHRSVNLGEIDAGRVLIVIVTERRGPYRVVTARAARRTERVF